MIWQGLRLLLALGLVALVGAGIARPEQGKRWYALGAYGFGVSFALGIAAVAGYMLILSAFGLSLSFWKIVLVAAVPVVSLALLAVRRSRVLPHVPSEPASGSFVSTDLVRPAIAIGLLALTTAFVFIGCFVEPISEEDPVAAWSFHAKLFFHNHTAFPAYLTSGASGPYASYSPPFLPLVQTWGHFAMGAYNDLAIKLVFCFIYVAILSVMFTALRRYVSKTYSLAVMLLVAAAPALVIPFPSGSVASGYADVPLSLFLAATACLLVFWASGEGLKPLVLASVLASSAMWTKREGMAFSIVATLLVWALALWPAGKRRTSNLRGQVIFTGVQAASMILLAMYKGRFPGTFAGEPVQFAKLLSGESVVRFVKLCALFVMEGLNPTRWGLLWIVAVLAIILRARQLRNPALVVPLWLIGGQVLVSVLFMTVSGYPVAQHAYLDMRRVLVTVAPIAGILIGLLSATEDRAASPRRGADA
ncbi:MAG TPA: hypothetical protein VMU02_11465 [bacterium]|nr:hypothetical protein [bacterium]